MLSEFRRGFDACTSFLVLQRAPVTQWERLFETYRFFEVRNANYVVVSSC